MGGVVSAGLRWRPHYMACERWPRGAPTCHDDGDGLAHQDPNVCCRARNGAWRNIAVVLHIFLEELILRNTTQIPRIGHEKDRGVRDQAQWAAGTRAAAPAAAAADGTRIVALTASGRTMLTSLSSFGCTQTTTSMVGCALCALCA